MIILALLIIGVLTIWALIQWTPVEQPTHNGVVYSALRDEELFDLMDHGTEAQQILAIGELESRGLL